jgi:hypothetical protein
MVMAARRRAASAYSPAGRRKSAVTSCPAAASSRMNHMPVNELPPVNRIFIASLRSAQGFVSRCQAGSKSRQARSLSEITAGSPGQAMANFASSQRTPRSSSGA